jgi:hypothetical protein
MNLALETKTEVKKLADRFNKFSAVEHLNKFQNETMPKIDKFSILIDKYLQESEDMKISIIKLDQVLSMKCNKSTINTL